MSKKLTIILTLTLAAVLIVATIVMANVNIYYGVEFKKPNYVYVEYSNNVARMASLKEGIKIKTLIEEASKDKVLAAFFKGDLQNKAKVTASSTNKTIPSTSGYKVRFVYENPQKLLEGNKAYKDGDGNSYTYTELVFIITKTEGENQVVVYAVEDSSSPAIYTHSYILDADYSNVYNYLNNQGYNQ